MKIELQKSIELKLFGLGFKKDSTFRSLDKVFPANKAGILTKRFTISEGIITLADHREKYIYRDEEEPDRHTHTSWSKDIRFNGRIETVEFLDLVLTAIDWK